jgi:LacI family transcriptional regulator
MARGPLTISDVAAAAGVSVSTVSKVINDRYGVSEQTSTRVREVIDSLGYRSSLVAQSLRSHRTSVIGVVARDVEPFNAELLKGVARAIRGTGYELVIFSDCGQGPDELGWERRSLARVSTLTDGAILVTPGTVDIDTRVPLVAVDHNASASGIATVDSDNLSGALAATEYLIRLGHRRIAFVGGRLDLASARLRAEGYRRALYAAGLPLDDDLIGTGDYQSRAAADVVRGLLALTPRPTAIFAASDVMAIEAMRVARGLGLTVPDALSVIGFDNVPESALSDPPLTTVDQSIQQMGYIAVRSLIDLIDRPTREPRQVMVPTRLVIRSSCRELERQA